MSNNLSRSAKEVKNRIAFDALFQELYPDHYQPQGNSRCPFHDDDRSSFEVHKDHGYDHAGCKPPGNSRSWDIFSLWQKRYECDFKTAVRELADKYGVTQSQSGSHIVGTYDYTDESGNLLYQVVRLHPKDFRQRTPDGQGGWTWKLGDTRRVLYHLFEVIQADTVWVTEGEKDADALVNLGLCGTTAPQGAGKWSKILEDGRPPEALQNKNVYILPDNDGPGRQHAEDIAHALHGFAASVKIVELPGLLAKGDVSDFIGKHGPEKAKALLLEIASKTGDYKPSSEAQNKLETVTESKKPSRFKILVSLLDSVEVEFFGDQFSEGWACLHVNDHWENVRIRSTKFRHFLTRIFFEETQEGVGRETLQQVQDLCSARAAYAGERRELFNRFAWVDNRLLIDLGRPDWKCVELVPGAWSLVTLSAPPFKRFSHMQELPEPDSQGQLEDILKFLPLKDQNSRILILVWVTTVPLAHVARPIIVLYGLQGSGKSTICVIIRALTDPSAVSKLSLPTRQDELIQGTDHHALVNFDNIHELRQWQSDSICTAVTGGGSTKRTLFTDEDDTIFSFRRAFVLNGINIPGAQPDLLDRAILVKTERIEEHERLEEEQFFKAFDQARPRIFGGLLNALAAAMSIRPSIKLARKPRMADWALWGCAVSEAVGIGQDLFLRAYHGAIRHQHDEVVESSPVCTALMEFLKEKATWSGTSTELYPELTKLAESMGLNKDREWPGAANALSRKLNELSHNLREVGIAIQNHPTARPRRITITKLDPAPYPQTLSEHEYRHNDNDSNDLRSDDISTVYEHEGNTVENTASDNQLELLTPDDMEDADDIRGDFDGPEDETATHDEVPF